VRRTIANGTGLQPVWGSQSIPQPAIWVFVVSDEETKTDKRAISVGLVGNCADVVPQLARRGIVPDILTDQTSAHDALNGYVPNGMSLEEALSLRASPRRQTPR